MVVSRFLMLASSNGKVRGTRPAKTGSTCESAPPPFGRWNDHVIGIHPVAFFEQLSHDLPPLALLPPRKDMFERLARDRNGR